MTTSHDPNWDYNVSNSRQYQSEMEAIERERREAIEADYKITEKERLQICEKAAKDYQTAIEGIYRDHETRLFPAKLKASEERVKAWEKYLANYYKSFNLENARRAEAIRAGICGSSKEEF